MWIKQATGRGAMCNEKQQQNPFLSIGLLVLKCRRPPQMHPKNCIQFCKRASAALETALCFEPSASWPAQPTYLFQAISSQRSQAQGSRALGLEGTSRDPRVQPPAPAQEVSWGQQGKCPGVSFPSIALLQITYPTFL